MSITSSGEPSSATAAMPVRLLSSVAVVGRDNEPIYLRGDLCHEPTAKEGGDGGPAASDSAADDTNGDAAMDEADPAAVEGGGDDGGAASPSGRGGKGLLGRIRGVVGGTASESAADDEEGPQTDAPDDDDDDDDPFGFFGSNSDGGHSDNTSAMSLTQQLVLHASLDRFEEMASRSNKGGAVRWRAPGSNAANAMWMGLLCEVEERWSVYGYLTNTGIKFMILVENVYMNPDGSRRLHDHALPSSTALSPSTAGSSSREAELKNMFAQLHDLYVRYTMNPFSRLRSPIQSRTFDRGIVQMARSFNNSALEQIGGSNGAEGLAWM